VMKSTTIIAFDQHAATTVAAVLLPAHRTPALHPLTSDTPTILRFVARLQRQGAVTCCYEAGPCGFELHRALTAAQDAFQRGARDAERLRAAMLEVLSQEPLARPVYVSAADPQTLQELTGPVEQALLSLAVQVGKPVLIDNLVIGDE